MRTRLVLGMAAAILLAPAAWAQSTLKIAVFDPQRISEETEEGKKVQADLTALRDRKQGELATKERELTELQNQLTAQALSLSLDRRTAMEKEIQKKALDLKQAREAAQTEMQFELATAQNRFQDRLLDVVEAFGRDEGFSLILDRNMVAFAAPTLDVTTAMVDRFNAATRAEKPPEPPTRPAAKGGK